MLLPIALSLQAVRDAADPRRRPGLMPFRQLRDWGVLVGDEEIAATIRELVKSLDSQEERNWLLLLAQHRLRQAAPDAQRRPLDEVLSYDDIRAWAPTADLLVLAQDHVNLLDGEELGHEPEVSSFRDLPHARAWARVSDLWSRPVANGTPRDAVWETYFAPVLRWVPQPNVYVLDQYAGKNLNERLASPNKTKTGDGAEWFLSRLARAKVQRIVLVTGAGAVRDKGADVRTAQSRILDWFAGLESTTLLDLSFVDAYFEAHHRRVAIDGWVGFQIDNGLASFDGPTVSAMSLPMSPSPQISQETRRQCDQFTGRPRRL